MSSKTEDLAGLIIPPSTSKLLTGQALGPSQYPGYSRVWVEGVVVAAKGTSLAGSVLVEKRGNQYRIVNSAASEIDMQLTLIPTAGNPPIPPEGSVGYNSSFLNITAGATFVRVIADGRSVNVIFNRFTLRANRAANTARQAGYSFALPPSLHCIVEHWNSGYPGNCMWGMGSAGAERVHLDYNTAALTTSTALYFTLKYIANDPTRLTTPSIDDTP